MSWYPEVLKKYATFDGRAGREEFWTYALFNFLIFFGFYLVALVSRVPILMVLYYLFTLAVLPATLAVGARRLHDTGKSGWYLLLELVPFGAIVLIVFWAQASEFGPNAYGAKAPTEPGELAPPAPAAMPVAASVTRSTGSTRPVVQPVAGECSSCDALLEPGAHFCSVCGAAAPARRRFCTSCGAGLGEGVRFCGKCGAASPGVA